MGAAAVAVLDRFCCVLNGTVLHRAGDVTPHRVCVERVCEGLSCPAMFAREEAARALCEAAELLESSNFGEPVNRAFEKED